MNQATSRHSGPIGAALLVTLFMVLLGFFAMHGVAAHGVGHGDGSHSSIPGVAEVGDNHASTEDQGQDTTETPASGSAAHEAPASPEERHGFGGEECLAILCLLSALVVLSVRRGSTVRPMFERRRMRSRLILDARPAEPPCLLRLSILRC